MNDDDRPAGNDRIPGWHESRINGDSGTLFHGVPLYAWHELKAICDATGGRPDRLQFRLRQDRQADSIDVIVVSTVATRRNEQAVIETCQRLHHWHPERDSWRISLNGKHLAYQDRVTGPSLGHLGSIVARALEDQAQERPAAPKPRQRQLRRDATHRTTGRSNWRPPRRDGPTR